AALENGFGHIVVSSTDKGSDRYGKYHMIVADKDRFLLDGREIARSVRISSKKDEKAAADMAGKTDIVVIETSNWRVIPLENLIVQFAIWKSRLFVRADNIEDAKLFLETMEKGADGIVFTPSDTNDIVRLADIISKRTPKIKLIEATVKNIRHLGLGDRVCIDTASILGHGEGMLVGNSSAGLFLVHAETHESEYVSSRPFRVNAGAVHAYTLLPDGNTKYLSELKTGDEVLIVDHKGNSKTAIVGRSKIERRPLLLIEAEFDNKRYSTMVQNAETIRLVSGAKSISVTDLKVGDKISMRIEAGGRHFGTSVKETIREK
ncbi:MAG: 3-dehydroquinate synthase II, partial [Thermoplasmata archaeon]